VFGAFVKAVKYSVLTGGLECAVVTRVVPCSLAERHGIRSGFYLIRVGRYEWPDFPGSRLVKELESGKRPLYLVLEEQQTFTPDLGDEEDQLPPQAPPPGQLEVAPPPHGEPPLRPWLHEEEAPAAPVTRPPPLNHGDSWPSEAAVLNAALESPSGQSRPSASPSRGFFRAATLPIPGNESSSDFVPPGAAPPDRKRRFPGRPRPTSAGSSQSQLRMAEARQSQELRPSSASAASGGFERRPASAGALRTRTASGETWLGALGASTAAGRSGTPPTNVHRPRSGSGVFGRQISAQSVSTTNGGQVDGRWQRTTSAGSIGSDHHLVQQPARPATAGAASSRGEGSVRVRPASAGDSGAQLRSANDDPRARRKRPSSAATPTMPTVPTASSHLSAAEVARETSDAFGRNLLGF